MWASTPPLSCLKKCLKIEMSENWSIIRITWESTIIYIEVKLASVSSPSLQTRVVMKKDTQGSEDSRRISTASRGSPLRISRIGQRPPGFSSSGGRYQARALAAGELTSPWAGGSEAAGGSAYRG